MLRENKKNDSNHFASSNREQMKSPKISLALYSNIIRHILEATYYGTVKVRTVKLQLLRREFGGLKMKEPETINQFMTQLTSLVNQLIVCGEDITD